MRSIAGRAVAAAGVVVAVVVAPCSSPTAGAAAPEDDWLWSEPVDLGTLGGEFSTAEAVDGDLVVGSAQTEKGAWHAYVLDLSAADPQMVDLGTLGGRHSRATDISGSVVVGTSKMERRRDGFHLFVLDLDEPAAGMVDLGPMGGSEIGDDPGPFVDDRLVAGQIRSIGPNSRTIAFSYDMDAANPRVVRYGTFGGGDSAAFAVRDGVVVGFADVPGDEAQAFVVHAREPDPELQPLGPPDVAGSALDVDDGLVVGHYWARAGSRPFAVDLADPERRFHRLGGGVGSATAVDGDVVVGASAVSGQVHPAVFGLPPEAEVTDLGTLGGWGRAVEVDGTMVVGYTYAPAGGLRPFADDLADDDALTDLGVLDGWGTARPTDVDGNVVVGQSGAAYDPRAVAWLLERTSQPRLRFDALERSVEEGAGTVTVTVERLGSTAGPASAEVQVMHSGYRGGKAGKDFGPVPTEVSFAAGETTTAIDVPILQDDRTEPRETIGLHLARPQGALLGGGRTTAVRIRTSDVRPDLLVLRPDDATALGDDVFSETAVDQTRSWSAPAAGTRTFFAEVCNDPRGDRPDDFKARLVLHAEGPRTTWTRGRRDVTEAITSEAGMPLRVYTDRCKRVKVTTAAGRNHTPGTLLATTLRADWVGENPAVDVVGTTVRVR